MPSHAIQDTAIRYRFRCSGTTLRVVPVVLAISSTTMGHDTYLEPPRDVSDPVRLMVETARLVTEIRVTIAAVVGMSVLSQSINGKERANQGSESKRFGQCFHGKSPYRDWKIKFPR